MALTADQWHILNICLFPVIDVLGIVVSVFLSSRKNRLLLACGVIFSAGVLLSGSLVHMLPHGSELLAEYFGGEGAHDDHGGEEEGHEEEEEGHHEEEEEGHDEEEDGHEEYLNIDGGGEEEGHDHPFPWSYTIFALTFLFLLCLEACMERYIDIHFGESGNFMHNDDLHKSGHEEEANKTGKIDEKGFDEENADAHDDIADTSKEDDAPKEAKNEQVKKEGDAWKDDDYKSWGFSSVKIAGNDDGDTPPNLRRRRSTWAVTAPRPSVVIAGPVPEAKQHMADNEEDQQTINPWVSILLTIVLSIHVIIEGLAINTTTDVATIRTTFIAIVVHKGFSAFSLGSSLIASGYWDKAREGGRKMFYILSGTFVCVDVLGLGLGIALRETFEGGGLASGVLLCMLGGSFLFVAAVELIPGELEKMRVFRLPIFPVLLSLLVGFGVMTLLGKWV